MQECLNRNQKFLGKDAKETREQLGIIHFSGTSAYSLNCKSWSSWADLPRQVEMWTVIENAFLCLLRDLGTILYYGWNVFKGNSKERLFQALNSRAIKCRKQMRGLSYEAESICFGKIKFTYAELETLNMPLSRVLHKHPCLVSLQKSRITKEYLYWWECECLMVWVASRTDRVEETSIDYSRKQTKDIFKYNLLNSVLNPEIDDYIGENCWYWGTKSTLCSHPF